MEKPTVSVIIPTYNRVDFLPEAIESVLAQTFDDNEIIVVDDGSTDGTEELVGKRYGGNVRYIRQKNDGVSAARNKGVQLAAGKYVAFLDSDDMWEGEKLERMIPFMERGDFCLAGHLTYLLKDGKLTRSIRVNETPLADGSLPDPRRTIVEGGFYRTLSFVATREAFLRSGGFRTDFSAAEDTLWAWKMCGLGRIGLLREYLSTYRMHEQQTASQSSNILAQRIAAHKIMLDTLGPEDSALRRAISAYISQALFKYACALRSEGRLAAGATAAAAALKWQPTVRNAGRLAIWFLGRDFRKRPSWRRGNA